MDGNRQITIPAGGIRTLYLDEESVFGVVSTSAAFYVKPRGGKKTLVDTGEKIGTAGGKKLGQITLSNTTAAAITATVYIGERDFDLAKVSVSTTVETTVSNDDTTPVPVRNTDTYSKPTKVVLNANATQDFTGLDGETNKRKSITVSNRIKPIGDAATDYADENIVWVGTSDTPEGLPVYPGGSVSLETGGAIRVTAGDTGATVSVIEVFYGSLA